MKSQERSFKLILCALSCWVTLASNKIHHLEHVRQHGMKWNEFCLAILLQYLFIHSQHNCFIHSQHNYSLLLKGTVFPLGGYCFNMFCFVLPSEPNGCVYVPCSHWIINTEHPAYKTGSVFDMENHSPYFLYI